MSLEIARTLILAIKASICHEGSYLTVTTLSNVLQLAT